MRESNGNPAHLRLQPETRARRSAAKRTARAEAVPLREDAERLFDLSLALLCVAGADGYFKRLNPAFERTLGYSREELLARPFSEFLHPEDRERTAREVEKLARGIPTVHFENRYRCKDGTYRWLAWTATPESARGLIYATALDITARRQEEERFRLIVEAAPDALIIVNERGEIVLANAPAEQMFGYPRQEMVGQSVELLVPGHLRGTHRAHRQRYQEDPQPRPMGCGAEFRAVRKDGSEFPAGISLGVLRTATENLTAAAIRDLTEQKRTTAALRENELQLLSAQRIQERLLSHAPPSVPGLDIAASLVAAEFTAGDHYDYLQMPDGSLGFVVSDVCGHGFSSALLMAATQTILRMLAQHHTDVSEILRLANDFLCEELEDNRFVTVFLGRLDVVTRSLVYGSAGHPTGYVFAASGAVKASLESTAVPLGLMASAQFPAAPAVTLEPGEILLLLTDGILETMGPDGEYFGAERVCEVVRLHRERSARDIIARLQEAIRGYSGTDRLTDDVTALVVKVGA